MWKLTILAILFCFLPALLAVDVFLIPGASTNIDLSAATLASDAAGATILGALPAADVDLKILANGDYTVNIDSALGSAINSIEVGALSGTQTLNVNQNLAVANLITVNSNGILTVNNALSGAGSARISGQLLQNAPISLGGDIELVSGATMNWNSGELSGNAMLNVRNGANLNTAGAATLTLSDRSISVEGTWTQSNTGTLNLNGVALVQSNGVMTISGTGNINGSGSLQINGQMNVNAAMQLGVSVVNNAQITLNQAASISSGLNQAAQNARLNMNAALTASSDAVLNIAAGSIVAASDSVLTITANAAMVVSNNPQLTGAGSLNVQGTLNLQGGDINFTGATSIASGATLRTSGDSTVEFNNGALNVAGTWNQENTARIVLNQATLIEGSGTLTFSGQAALSGTGALTIQGTANINGGAMISLPVINQNQLNFSGENTISANLNQNSASARIALNNDALLNLNGDSTFTLTNGQLLGTDTDGDANTNVLAVISGSTLVIGAASSVSGRMSARVEGTLQLDGGNINMDGDINILSGATLLTENTADMTLQASNIRISGRWTQSAPANIAVNSNVFLESGAELVLEDEGSLTGSGTINNNNGATIRLQNGGISVGVNNNGLLQITQSATLAGQLVQSNSNAQLNIAGGASLTLSDQDAVSLIQGGSLKVDGNTAGNLIVSSGASLQIGGMASVSGMLAQNIQGTLILEGDMENTADTQVSGVLEMRSGTIGGEGNLFIQPSGTLRTTGTTTLTVNGKTIILQGNFEQSNSAQLALNSRLNIESDGTFTLSSPSSIGGSGSIVNSGSIVVNSASSMMVAMRNNGNLILNANLNIAEDATQTSTAGARLALQNNADLIISGNTVFTVEGGSISVSASSKKRETTSSDIVVEADSTFNLGADSEISGTLNIIVRGTFLQNGDITNDGLIEVYGRFVWISGTAAGNGNFIIYEGASFETTNSGEIILGENRLLSVRGAWSFSGTGNLLARSNMEIENRGTFTTLATGTINTNSNTGSIVLSIRDGAEATFNKDSTYDVIIQNNGKLTLSNADITFRGFTQDGSSAEFYLKKSNIIFTASSDVRFENGEAFVAGTIQGGRIVFSGAELMVGQVESQIDTMTIKGNLVLEDNTVVVVDYTNINSLDKIAVSGTAFFQGGKVRFAFIGNLVDFNIVQGNRFNFITYANFEGELDTVDSDGMFSADFVLGEDQAVAVVSSVDENEAETDAATTAGVSLAAMGIAALAIAVSA